MLMVSVSIIYQQYARATWFTTVNISESINFHNEIQNSIILSNIRKYNREKLGPADEIYPIPTQEFNIGIPDRLVERVEEYASKTGTTITNVVIEALDIFLREQKMKLID